MASNVNKNPESILNPALEKASTLPSPYYTDPAILESEKKNIFWRTWQIVGREEQVAKPGDYFTTDLCGEPSACTISIVSISRRCRAKGIRVSIVAGLTWTGV